MTTTARFAFLALATGLATATPATPAAPATPARAQAVAPGPDTSLSRGELLYTTHCIACHGTEIHWRDKRMATDWPSLQAWVATWQGRMALRWTDDDIAEVARHLNDTVYHFPRPAVRVGWVTGTAGRVEAGLHRFTSAQAVTSGAVSRPSRGATPPRAPGSMLP